MKVVLATLAALVLAAPAAAEELASATVCGASGCRTIADRDRLAASSAGCAGGDAGARRGAPPTRPRGSSRPAWAGGA